MKVTVDVNAAKFERAMRGLLRVSDEEARYVVKEATKFFMESAALATAPNAGRKIGKRMYKRKMIRFVGFHFKDGSIGWRNPGERKKKTDSYMWRVLYNKGSKKGVWNFETKAEAQEAQIIKYRGIGRAGWSSGLPKIGFSIPEGPTPAASNRAFGLNVVVQNLRSSDPSITVTNRVSSIERHSAHSASLGLSKAANRINFLSRQIRQRIEAEGNK